MKALVTGGAGFIGSHYVRSMLAGRYPGWEEACVTVVDSLTYAGDLANLPENHPRLRFVRGDVCDEELLDTLVPGHDAVVHFAAESHVDRSLTGARAFVRTNVLGTQTLLESCLRAGVPRIVHVSTDEVYGTIGDGSWSESAPLEPNSPYAASKAAADLVARAYHRSHGLPVVTTRCCNNYGPHQFAEKIIPLFVTRLLSGRTVPLYGDGRQVREWQHVDDHCRGIQLALEQGRPGAVYNLAGGTALSNLELTGRLLRLCGADWRRVEHVADRKGHDRRYALDGTLAGEELGHRPLVPFDEGLAATVQWYKDNRARWTVPPERGTAEARPRRRPAGPTAAVVGAAGFVGGQLCPLLARDGDVATFTRARRPLDDAGRPASRLVAADTVFYLASSVNPALAEGRPDLIRADYDAFVRLLDALVELETPPLVVLTSSGGAVYDPDAPVPYAETSATRPVTAYGAAKLALECALRERSAAVPGIALRLSNVYGTGQRAATGQGVLAHWLAALADGRPVPVIGDPVTSRDYVHVDDVVAALRAVRVAHLAGRPLDPVLNIGSGEPTSLSSLLKILEATVNGNIHAEYLPRRYFDRHETVLDVTRAGRLLGWRPRVALADGIERAWRSLPEPPHHEPSAQEGVLR